MYLNFSKEREAEKYYRAQKITLYWLLGFIYTAFIGLQLGRVQAIADYNYSLHEMMYLPSTIAMFVVPLLFLVYIFFFIKYLRRRANKLSSLKTSLLSVLVITSLVGIFSLTYYQANDMSTTGVYEVEQKLLKDRKYYILFDNKEVRVSRNEYYLVEENEEYLIGYVWNKNTPNEGKLETIETLE
ncbi:hypothetical protein RZN22_17490 [Bacillaceae bacterium S4-13-58]